MRFPPEIIPSHHPSLALRGHGWQLGQCSVTTPHHPTAWLWASGLSHPQSWDLDLWLIHQTVGCELPRDRGHVQLCPVTLGTRAVLTQRRCHRAVSWAICVGTSWSSSDPWINDLWDADKDGHGSSRRPTPGLQSPERFWRVFAVFLTLATPHRSHLVHNPSLMKVRNHHQPVGSPSSAHCGQAYYPSTMELNQKLIMERSLENHQLV